MWRVGLTGGIASGKSRVGEFMTKAGAIVLDADHIAHQLMSPGQAVYEDVVAYFGNEIVGTDGQIDRIRLGQHIFARPEERLMLNRLVHPAVRQRFSEAEAQYRIEEQALDKNFLFVPMIPLLIESGLQHLADEIWLVYCAAETQISRLMARNQLSRIEAEQRLHAQMPIEDKKNYADRVIDNSDSFELTAQQIQQFLGVRPWDPYVLPSRV